MKTIAIMQPYFFPYIGYFQLINAVDEFIIYDDVTYIKQGWIARNRILIKGKEHFISLQLHGASSNKLINDICVGDNRPKILKTISQVYARAPYFKEAYPVVEAALTTKSFNLSAYLEECLRLLCGYLQIDTDIVVSSTIDKNDGLRGQGKVMHICEKRGAKRYVNSIGGVELYERATFQSRGIELKFLKTQEISYNQTSRTFVPGLSIIDVMMFNSLETITTMLDKYDLVEN
ncbi:MAG: WbqC family protein [Kiritimatiellae bacterium]|nr:WbqC family protein [Kiritimatiellia bacterium]